MPAGSGQLTGTMPALPAGWILGRSISVTADDRTFTVAAETPTVCPSSTATRTRFHQFSVTSTGHVTGLLAVGKPVTGEPVISGQANPAYQASGPHQVIDGPRRAAAG